MVTTPCPDLARRLQEARRSSGLTQAQAATAVGVDESTIANWERLRGEPRASQIVTLARTYGTTPQALLDPLGVIVPTVIEGTISV